jgi:hypothetical protein
LAKQGEKSEQSLARIAEQRILRIRGQSVIVDADLAELYGVTTKRLNEQVKRNAERFPEDFVFRLTNEEKLDVVANCDHLASLKFSPTLPYAFTEHGAIMAAGVLNSEQAVQTSIWVVRSFVRLRKLLAEYTEVAAKLRELEKKYDSQFKVVFDALRKLMQPAESEKKERIGFVVRGKSRTDNKQRRSGKRR